MFIYAAINGFYKQLNATGKVGIWQQQIYLEQIVWGVFKRE